MLISRFGLIWIMTIHGQYIYKKEALLRVIGGSHPGTGISDEHNGSRGITGSALCFTLFKATVEFTVPSAF
jgi:hypothetical protein